MHWIVFSLLTMRLAVTTVPKIRSCFARGLWFAVLKLANQVELGRLLVAEASDSATLTGSWSIESRIASEIKESVTDWL